MPPVGGESTRSESLAEILDGQSYSGWPVPLMQYILSCAEHDETADPTAVLAAVEQADASVKSRQLAETHIVLALLFLRHRDYTRAADHAEKAITACPEDALIQAYQKRIRHIAESPQNILSPVLNKLASAPEHAVERTALEQSVRSATSGTQLEPEAGRISQVILEVPKPTLQQWLTEEDRLLDEEHIFHNCAQLLRDRKTNEAEALVSLHVIYTRRTFGRADLNFLAWCRYFNNDLEGTVRIGRIIARESHRLDANAAFPCAWALTLLGKYDEAVSEWALPPHGWVRFSAAPLLVAATPLAARSTHGREDQLDLDLVLAVLEGHTGDFSHGMKSLMKPRSPEWPMPIFSYFAGIVSDLPLLKLFTSESGVLLAAKHDDPKIQARQMVEAHVCFALVALHKKEFDKVEKHMSEAMKADPDDPLLLAYKKRIGELVEELKREDAEKKKKAQ